MHLCVTLPLVLRFWGGINLLVHFKNMVDPIDGADILYQRQ